MTTKTYYVYFLAKETNDLIHFVEDLKNTVVLMLPCLLFIVHCPTAKGYADCHTSDIGHWFAMTLIFTTAVSFFHGAGHCSVGNGLAHSAFSFYVSVHFGTVKTVPYDLN